MKINVMLIGIGPHAKRIYLPFIQKYKEKYSIDLKAVVDIASQEKQVKAYLQDNNISAADHYYVNYGVDREYIMSEKDSANLKKLIEKHKINAIILASDPLSHKAYVELAMEKGVNILMDKPITLEVNASTNEYRARKIFNDFQGLVRRYCVAEEKYPNLIVSCMSQRRYHPAMKKIKKELKKVYEKTNCPITSIVCEHSDGQWRMPDEVVNEKYHGYTNGVGKCSHSGYHEFDVMHWFGEIAKDDKKYDKVTCYASFVRPEDYIAQLNNEDYKRIFKDTRTDCKFDITDEEFIKKTKNYGEIDAHINFTFCRGSKKITEIQFSLLHSGFSKRTWVFPNKNLYKGNGRIRHEYFSIHQGPFQSIKYESYISADASDELKGSGQVGGKLHADAFIFKNTMAIGDNLEPFEKIQFGVLNENGPIEDFREFQLAARAECFKEFMMAVKGKIPKEKLKSSINAHLGSVLLMSLAYLSAAKGYNGKNPIAEYNNGSIK